MTRFVILLVAGLCSALVSLKADSVVVFNEVMYHPESNEAALEFVELYNQMAVDVDLSGWTLQGGIGYTFPAGTVLGGGKYLVVASNPTELMKATGLTFGVVGPFTGRLSNSGEQIDLVNFNNRLMDSVDYDVEDEWPVSADGAGPSLGKKDPDWGSAEAKNWTASWQAGGTPGKLNFPLPFASPLPEALISEIAPSTANPYWIELQNQTDATLVLAGYTLALQGDNDRLYTFTDETIPAGGYLQIPQTKIGARPGSGDRIFLRSSSGLFLDAIVVKRTARARSNAHGGAWFVPSSLTPGSANQFNLNQSVVINEIMYQPRPIPARAAEYESEQLVAIDASWKYEQSGGSLPANWTESSFNDTAWPSGRGVLYVEEAALPAPKGTALTRGQIAYYFRTKFQSNTSSNVAELSLRPLIDDGAVFYLNGKEIYRFNIPEGNVTSSTVAFPSVGDAVFTGPVTITVTNLLKGENVMAVEVHQASAGSTDIVMGLELSAQTLISPATPFRENDEEWVELFNHSSEPVNLRGWSFDKGISYTFPAGTILNGQSYLVVARHAASMVAKYPDIQIVGNFTNSLSGSGELLSLVDANENLVDQAHYYDSAPWPSYPDGYGASLEKIDPRGRGMSAEAWGASDESSKSQWRTYSYTGVAQADGGPTLWKEFVFGLLDAGEILIDDISVIEDPSGARKQLLKNTNFTNGTQFWRFLGTHKYAEIIEDPAQPGNKVLKLRSTGQGEHMHNHVETTLVDNQPIVNGRTYTISYRAKWLAGNNSLNTRLYFNRLAKTTLLQAPDEGGTPGKVNSIYKANKGPDIAEMNHLPAVPSSSQSISVKARVGDRDGVKRVSLWYGVNGANWREEAMTAGAGGLYQGTIPGQTSPVIQFYIEAEDNLGSVSQFPAEGRASRVLIKLRDNQAPTGRLHNLRLVMLPSDAAALHAPTNVMSNDLVPATFIYNEREVFYNVRLHLQSSQRGRMDSGRVGFTIKFPADHLFRGVHDTITLDRSGGYSGNGGRHDEIILRHMMNQAGGLPDMYNDLVRAIAPRTSETSTAMLLMSKYGGEFLENSYENGNDGMMFKIELIYYPLTSVDGDPEKPKIPNPDDVIPSDFQDMGDSKDAYRWFFLVENNQEKDDYSKLMEVAKFFDTSGTVFAQKAPVLLDVDQWMRVFAFKSLSGDVDTYGFGYAHNHMFYIRPEDQRMLTFPWDMDFAWTRSPNDNVHFGARAGKLLDVIAFRRLYYGHLLDLITRVYNPSYISPWVSHYGTVAGQNYSGINNYIASRRAFVLSQLPAIVPFSMTSTNQQMVSSTTVTLRGKGGINVKDISFGGKIVPLNWLAMDTWEAQVPVNYGLNQLPISVLNFAGEEIATNLVTVTSTASGGRPDTDNDGMPDEWEATMEFNPAVDDSAADEDNDGMSNLQEYLAGTDPLDADDKLAMRFELMEGQLQFSFKSVPGRRYSLLSREAGETTWQTVRTFAATQQGADQVAVEPIEQGTDVKFYQLVVD